MIKIISKADVRRLEKRVCQLLRRDGWQVKIGRSPVSPSVFLDGQLGTQILRIRVSDHLPKPHIVQTMHLLVHPGGNTVDDLIAFLDRSNQLRSPLPPTHSNSCQRNTQIKYGIGCLISNGVCSQILERWEIVMDEFEKWVEENFDRQSASMDGSCETVKYVPRFKLSTPFPPASARFSDRRNLVKLVTLCLFGTLVLIGALIA